MLQSVVVSRTEDGSAVKDYSCRMAQADVFRHVVQHIRSGL